MKLFFSCPRYFFCLITPLLYGWCSCCCFLLLLLLILSFFWFWLIKYYKFLNSWFLIKISKNKTSSLWITYLCCSIEPTIFFSIGAKFFFSRSTFVDGLPQKRIWVNASVTKYLKKVPKSFRKNRLSYHRLRPLQFTLPKSSCSFIICFLHSFISFFLSFFLSWTASKNGKTGNAWKKEKEKQDYFCT